MNGNIFSKYDRIIFMQKKVELPVNYAGKVFNSNQKPSLELFLLQSESSRPLVLICPGGGYAHLSTREATPVAQKMNELGFHSAVLSYSLAPMEFPAALCDLAEAVAFCRKNCAALKIDSKNIIVAGFSAGGHLAASLGCYWKSGLIQNILPYMPEQTRPNRLLLCYPVITSDRQFCHEESIENVLGKANLDERDFVSIEFHVDSSFPPTFIWHTFQDESVPIENSLALVRSLREAKIPFEFHAFERGCHGLALATPQTAKADGSCQEAECTVWPELFRNWFYK